MCHVKNSSAISLYSQKLAERLERYERNRYLQDDMEVELELSYGNDPQPNIRWNGIWY